MPIYKYICKNCEKIQERLYRGTPLTCEKCGGELVKKLSYDGITARYVGAGFTKGRK